VSKELGFVSSSTSLGLDKEATAPGDEGEDPRPKPVIIKEALAWHTGKEWAK
jgi:hypothetical protein